MGVPESDRTGERRRLVLNPTSGRKNHVEQARRLAETHGFAVEETEREGHATELARQAAQDGVDLLASCGGDGTLHEIVQGLYAADALDSVTLCVIPAGTENIVATDIGIDDLADGFDVAESGETRRIDLGLAGGEPFVMSAIAGLPADVSSAATPDLKRRFGSAAFLVGGLREGLNFDGLRAEVDAVSDDGETEWAGEAMAILVGNLRRFGKSGGQANVEDGLFEVTIVEQMPPDDAVTEFVEQRLLHRDTSHVRELRTKRLDVHCFEREPMTFSLDGEIRTFDSVELAVIPRALRLRVGEKYTPTPEET